MTHPSENESKNSSQLRADITTKIWGFATGMLAICIPLSAVTKSGPFLPFTVITGAAVGTGAVWYNYDKKYSSNALLKKQVDTLEERIANLETIIGNEETNFQLRIQQLHSRDNLRKN